MIGKNTATICTKNKENGTSFSKSDRIKIVLIKYIPGTKKAMASILLGKAFSLLKKSNVNIINTFIIAITFTTNGIDIRI